MRFIAIAIFAVFVILAAALPYVLYRPSPLQVSATGSPLSGPTPLAVSFLSSASGGSGLLRFFWDFGDGESSSEANPKHTYQFPGTYNATLQVSDLRETRPSPVIQITSTTTRFDFRDNLTAASPDRFVRGEIRSAFVIEGRGNVSTTCSVQVSNASVFQGDCASFVYVYKTKRSAEAEARFDVNVSVHRNATDAGVSITVTGQMSLAYQTTFDVRESTDTVRDARLDGAGPAGAASRTAYQVSLNPGASKSYTVLVDGGLWVNLSASVSIQYSIQEEVTTVIQGDCRRVSAFTWIKQTETSQVKVNITLTYIALNPAVTAIVELELFGSFQVIA